jgi:hypothetical protein
MASAPPATIPAVAPAVVVACQMASALFLAAPPESVVVKSDNAAADNMAATAPWAVRAAINVIGHSQIPKFTGAQDHDSDKYHQL